MAYQKQNFINYTVLTAEQLNHIEDGIVQNAIDIQQIKDNGIGVNIEPSEDDIPKVFFGGNLPQTKDEEIMSFRYISKTMDISGYCKTKAQGDSSMNYPKKNQTVKLYSDPECTQKMKLSFKNWGKQNKFCFKANWIDLTHARNVVSARLWGDVVKSRSNYAQIPEELRTSPNQGAVDGFPVKVYANGVYQGRYTINIPKDAWMSNMDDELDEHCILCGETNWEAASLFRTTAVIDGTDWSDEVHDTVPDIIKTRWNDAINFVVNSTDDEFVSGIGNYFDVSSLIDYYLFGLASCGFDAFGKNQLYMTYDAHKWYATMYDMDSTWGLWWNGEYFVSSEYTRNEYQDFKYGNGNLLYIRLESLFVDTIKERWLQLRKSALSVENIINRFERFTDIVEPWIVEEDFANTTAGGNFIEIPLKNDNNIQQIRRYIVDRLTFCDIFVSNIGTNNEYKMLSYIESNGTQYIDTGISGGTNAEYIITFDALDSSAVDWEHYFSGNTRPPIPKLYSNKDGYIVANGPSNAGNILIVNRGDVSVVEIHCKSTGELLLNGTNVAPTGYPSGGGWGDMTWYIFNSHGEPNLMSSMKLYKLKMYTNGELVRDFVPAQRNSDGVFGLYDNVSKTFFENKGTGAFTGA